VTENHQVTDVWDVRLPAQALPGIYIAISGNTAAGKSSLVTRLEKAFRDRGHDAVGISERAFHPRYLQLMFSEPKSFAFPIQLHFMLHRHMLLHRNLLHLGRTVVMERSHLDDALFVEEHVRQGSITPAQRDAYTALAAVLHEQIPMPDVMVLMNPDPDLSLERLLLAERNGARPAEFPSEDAKRGWVHRWYALYCDYHHSLRARQDGGDPALARTTLIEVDPTADTSMSAARILKAVLLR